MAGVCLLFQRLQELKQVIVREIVLSLQHGMRQLKEITQTILISK